MLQFCGGEAQPPFVLITPGKTCGIVYEYSKIALGQRLKGLPQRLSSELSPDVG
jgi:hypothetical protein